MLYILHKKYYDEDEDFDGILETRDLNILVAAQLLRLLRIPRVNSLLHSSIAFQTWWERQDVPRAMLAAFIFKLVMVSHWIACLWSFIAYAQAWSFGAPLAGKANWISHWYETSYVEGGIDPIGWTNDIDRYALSLFWSVQSITSIGYGNLVPVTRVEYYFANMLMLCSGLFWAFAIGNIIGVVHHMNSAYEKYKQDLEGANRMIKAFSLPDDQGSFGVGESEAVASRIRRFVHSQYDGRKALRPEEDNSPGLDEIFPTLRGLSLELRRLASLHLFKKYLDMIPYLSSNHLSTEEQSDLAFRCKCLEFSRGELFVNHPLYGRGILIPLKGMALNIRTVKRHGESLASFHMHGIGDPIGVNDVLVEDSFFENGLPEYRFICFTSVVFIPQSVIFDTLHAKKSAWKDCARWRYLQTCLLRWSQLRDDDVLELR